MIKKRIISWLILVCILTILGMILFVTGQQHSVIIDNTNAGEKQALEEVSYSIDGAKIKKVKKNKKVKAIVKGSNHSIVVEIVNNNDKMEKIQKEFKIEKSSNAIINVPILASGEGDWLKQQK